MVELLYRAVVVLLLFLIWTQNSRAWDALIAKPKGWKYRTAHKLRENLQRRRSRNG